MEKRCYFLNGKLINIGEWDLQIQPATESTPKKIGNPLPEGVTSEIREVVTGPQGGFFLADDHAILRKQEYPSIADQLDAIWKGGKEVAAMRDLILSIKAKYPKQ